MVGQMKKQYLNLSAIEPVVLWFHRGGVYISQDIICPWWYLGSRTRQKVLGGVARRGRFQVDVYNTS